MTTDIITAIRARWADAGPWHYAEEIDDDVTVGEIRDVDGNTLLFEYSPDDTERMVLTLAAAASIDIAALLDALDVERAVLALQARANADLLRRLAASEAEFRRSDQTTTPEDAERQTENAVRIAKRLGDLLDKEGGMGE